MKNLNKVIIVIVLIIIAALVMWRINGSSVDMDRDGDENATTTLEASQTVVVSNKISEYKNDELGFSIKHPTAWEKTEAPTNVSFILPIDTKEKNTVENLEAKVDIISGKCSFPPVTTVKERSTMSVDGVTANMISIANTVQTRNFFSRMYSIQKDSICYFFTFSSITSNPTSKGFTGADAQVVAAKNTVIVDAADTQFKDMVKSFKFVTGPAGKDETSVAPKK